MASNTRVSAPLPVALVLVLLVALIGAIGGGATAAKLITGKDIKNNTVSSKDVKNRSLKLKDVKKSAVAKLKGRDGASAFAAPPSGTMLVGGGIASGLADSENDTVYSYAPLSARLRSALDDDGAGRNMYVAPHEAFQSSDESVSRCSGSVTAPTASPGTLCVYVDTATNVIPGSARLRAGSGFLADAAERSGFQVSGLSDAVGTVLLRYVWAYRAP